MLPMAAAEFIQSVFHILQEKGRKRKKVETGYNQLQVEHVKG